MKKEKLILDFINSYFQLFHASTKDISFENENVIGTIIWEDTNEYQNFLWSIPKENINFYNLIELIKYLIKNNLIDGDKIVISKDNLIANLKNLKWDIKKIDSSLLDLSSINIAMVDDDKIIDYFFVHF